MPQFRYEAIDSSGVPVHGVAEATDRDALAEQIKVRGLQLVSTDEVSLDSLVNANKSSVPRLFQLRIGEQLREALLTGLPAHEAVRAIAAEPISHPVPGLVPWLWAAVWLVFAVALGCWSLTGSFLNAVIAVGLFGTVAMPIIAWGVRWIFQMRPRNTLRKLADRLEAGEPMPASLAGVMPRELRCVMNSNVDDASKARVAADLIPSLLGGNLRIQQFVMTLVGPILLMGLIGLGMYSVMLFIMPKFKKIFEDFGTDLPGMTRLVISISDVITKFGVGGWLTLSVAIVVLVITLAMCLASNRGAEMLEKIPVFGMAFRWAMQARVARVLSSMIRNGCSYPEALQTSTAGSGFASVKQQGEMLAKELESKSGVVIPAQKLSGLPISMLFVEDNQQMEEDRRAIVAETFQSLAEMLDSATLGQGRLFALILQFSTIMFTAFAIGFGVIAMFLPLIKLLNDLS